MDPTSMPRAARKRVKRSQHPSEANDLRNSQRRRCGTNTVNTENANHFDTKGRGMSKPKKRPMNDRNDETRNEPILEEGSRRQRRQSVVCWRHLLPGQKLTCSISRLSTYSLTAVSQLMSLRPVAFWPPVGPKQVTTASICIRGACGKGGGGGTLYQTESKQQECPE